MACMCGQLREPYVCCCCRRHAAVLLCLIVAAVLGRAMLSKITTVVVPFMP